ncbi:MAG TPA: hypothetical protein VN515_03670 [Terriglobales bacterium]|nr:hypothetical protein [Terriglobales bacterium]
MKPHSPFQACLALSFCLACLILPTPSQSQSAIVTGTVTLTAGSLIRRGPATLEVRLTPGSPSTRLQFDFNDGRYVEVAADSVCPPRAKCPSRRSSWSDASRGAGTHTITAPPPETAWFFPAWGRWVTSPAGAVVADLGSVVRHGMSERHLRVTVPRQPFATSDIFLDPVTGLASAEQFALPPDSGRGSPLQVEVRYSDYRLSSGVEVPFHVQRYLNGSLNLDLTLAAAQLGGSLPDTDFVIAGGAQ